jgi:hypothetical protein
MIAVGAKVFYREDGTNMRADVTRVVSATVVDLAVHDDDGCLVHGVTEAKLAVSATDRKTDGRWFPRT